MEKQDKQKDKEEGRKAFLALCSCSGREYEIEEP